MEVGKIKTTDISPFVCLTEGGILILRLKKSPEVTMVPYVFTSYFKILYLAQKSKYEKTNLTHLTRIYLVFE